MDKEGLEAIYRCINKTKIKEIHIETGKGTELRITRSAKEIQDHVHSQGRSTSKTIPSSEVDAVSSSFDINSPEVGFFNRFDPKSKQQYQKLRDVVQKGDIVGTIVSLHTHHHVVAQDNGKIIEFLVEQDQPVAYGQPLIRLEKVNLDN